MGRHGSIRPLDRPKTDVFHALDEVGAVSRWFATGHSQGCGLSTLAVPDVLAHRPAARLQHDNLASLRVGDVTFAARYNRNGVPTFRVVNTSHVVPQVPPAVAGRALYEHVGIPVDFTANYGSVGRNHNLTGAYLAALEHPDPPKAQNA